MKKDWIIVANKSFPVEKIDGATWIAGIKLLDGEEMSASLEEVYKKIAEETGLSCNAVFRAFAMGALNRNEFPSISEATNFYLKEAIEDLQVFAKANETSFTKFTEEESRIHEDEIHDNNWK